MRFRILLTLTLVAAATSASAQFYDESSTSGYWYLEQQRQQRFFMERQRLLRQSPTHMISRAPPMRAVKPTDRPQQNPSENDIAEAQDKRPRVAVIGDDLASDLFNGLNEIPAERETIRFQRRTKDNSGLVRDDFYDWAKTARALTDGKERIDLAVMLIGANDRQPLRDGKAVQDMRSPRWKELYAARARAIGEIFREKKIPLVWAGLPIVGNDKAASDLAEMNELLKQAARETDASFVDLWEAFADERGHFSSYGPDIEGQMVRLRTSDGLHFTHAGARKMAHFVDGEIARILGEKAKAATASLTPQQAVPPPQARRPDIGPVLQLNTPPVTKGGALMRADTPVPESESTLARSLAVAPKSGRADDYNWSSP